MKSFYDKDEYTIEDLRSLIDTQAEESVYLEFKEAGALVKDERSKTSISKDIASFANSDGGIIIYGLKEEEHKASEFSFIDGNVFTKEWLEQVINSSIQRHISGLKIYPIRDNSELNRTIYVVKIPASVDSPHLSRDNRYYKRNNFASVPMEEYEVRQNYGRKGKIELQPSGYNASVSIQDEIVKVEFDFFIANVGNVLEETYKLNVYISGILEKEMGLQWQQTGTNLSYIRLNDRFKISALGTVPIFSQESLTIATFKMVIPIAKAYVVLQRLKLEGILFFSIGRIEKEYDVSHVWQLVQTQFQKIGYDWMTNSVV